MSIKVIVFCLVGIAAIWMLIELALTVRRTRSTMDIIDKTVNELNDTIQEARPMVAKLDGAIDDLQPALTAIEPLVKNTNIAVEALNANMLEINSVLRDVSVVSNTAADVANTAAQISENASQTVSRLLTHNNLKKQQRIEDKSLQYAQDSSESCSALDDSAKLNCKSVSVSKTDEVLDGSKQKSYLTSKGYFTYDNQDSKETK